MPFAPDTCICTSSAYSVFVCNCGALHQALFGPALPPSVLTDSLAVHHAGGCNSLGYMTIPGMLACSLAISQLFSFNKLVISLGADDFMGYCESSGSKPTAETRPQGMKPSHHGWQINIFL